MCVCTQAGVGAVWIYSVSRSARADEASSIQVGALVLAQQLITVSIVAKVCIQTTQSMFSDIFRTAFSNYVWWHWSICLHGQSIAGDWTSYIGENLSHIFYIYICIAVKWWLYEKKLEVLVREKSKVKKIFNIILWITLLLLVLVVLVLILTVVVVLVELLIVVLVV